MIWLLVIMAVWYLIGQAIFLHVCYLIRPVIVVKDLMVSLFAGLLGPFALMFYAKVENSWLNTEIYRGKRK